MELAPVMHVSSGKVGPALVEHSRWRQVHFAAKSAPQHRDFAAGKVRVK